VAALDDGRLVAVNPGATTLSARHGWLEDSLVVAVTTEQPRRLLFNERDWTGWTKRWQAFGFPLPETLSTTSGTVLRLTGDGTNEDGLFSREGVDGTRGLTLDMEFRLWPLSRTERQAVSVCLSSIAAPLSREEWPLPPKGFCFHYPFGELEAFDSGRAALRLWAQGVIIEADVHDLLPTKEWVRLRMVVRADGTVLAYLNGRELPVPGLRMIPGGSDWRIDLRGKALDTDVWVRNLNLWEGSG
jgi:hypothetical protein